jgi:hypothetical protein
LRPRYRVLSVLLAAFLLLPGALCLAQEAPPEENAPVQTLPVYSLGQQSLYISAGLMIPLFFQSFGGAVSDTNLSLGAAGSLQWGIHLDNHWLLGIEVGGMFAKSLQENFLYMLPITAKAAYIFHLFPFEIPVFLGTGIDIVKYREQAHVDWILKPGFSTVWKYNMSWGFGLNLSYWWVLQPWSTDPALARMGNFLDITATAQYNF